MPDTQNDKNEREAQQGTNKPWEKPGQSSQNPGDTPAKPERKPSDNETS